MFCEHPHSEREWDTGEWYIDDLVIEDEEVVEQVVTRDVRLVCGQCGSILDEPTCK